MKYKDFKTLTVNEMKQIRGGDDLLPPGGGTCGDFCNLTCTMSTGQAGSCHFGTGSNAGRCFCSWAG